MPITINGNGIITGAATLATPVGSPTFTTPNIDSAQFATVSGTAPLYACRAWVNFNGTGTVAIRASGNVTSITDNGTGDYTINFTTAMSDVNYAACFGAKSFTTGNSGDSVNLQEHPTVAATTSAFRVVFWRSSTGNFIDRDNAYVAIFR